MEQANSRKRSTYIALVVGAIFLAVILYQQATSFSSKGFVIEANKKREQKDLQFTNDPNSPIPLDQKDSFEGLLYYPPKEKFKVKAELIPPSQQDTLKLLTTKGKFRKMLAAGTARFSIDDKAYQLIAYQYIETDEPTLFIPFTDETTGEFTYGGGRYLDIPLTDDLYIDFNEAYNPYCVYNEKFSCPIPPRENHIPIRILAGERDYK